MPDVTSPLKSEGEPPFIVLIGAPGSGKSRWARENFPRRAIASLDEMRGRIADDEGNQDATLEAVDAWHAIIRGRARLGRLVVVDATNSDPTAREQLLSYAHRWCRTSIAVIFETPLSLCLTRNDRRPPNRRVPAAFVREVHARVRDEFPVERTWMAAGFSGTAWVIHGDGMRTGGSVVMDSARFYGDAPWLAAARLSPVGDRWPRHRKSNWEGHNA